MKFIKLPQNIYQVEVDTQYELCMTFIRLQEFYESPFEEIRGKYFSLEKYMDRYAAEYGNFTYPVDWNGFNVPGDVVRDFFNSAKFSFGHNLSHKEYWLYHTLFDAGLIVAGAKDKFYLLGTHTETEEKGLKENEALDHEYAHAFWYLSSEYRRNQEENLSKLSEETTQKIHEALREKGYAEELFEDETQAYLSTSTKKDLRETFTLWPDFPTAEHRAIKKYYKQYRKDYGI
jgi:hypothetical protein